MGRFSLCVAIFILVSGMIPGTGSAAAVSDADLLRRPMTVTELTLDIRDFLEGLSRSHGISVLAGSRVRGVLRAKRDEHGQVRRPAIEGATLGEVLNNATRSLGFGWRLIDGSLYVADELHLARLIDSMNSPRPTSVRAAFGKRLNAKFGSVDLHQLSRILRQQASVDIRVAASVQDRLLLQAIDVPWERVLLAMVHLNGLRMVESEFSITIIGSEQ
jgi:hypothetical protein